MQCSTQFLARQRDTSESPSKRKCQCRKYPRSKSPSKVNARKNNLLRRISRSIVANIHLRAANEHDRARSQPTNWSYEKRFVTFVFTPCLTLFPQRLTI